MSKAPVAIGIDGGVGISSPSERGAAEGSEILVATGSTCAASADRGHGGKEGGGGRGEGKTVETFSCFQGNSTKKCSGPSFSLSSSGKTSGGVPSAKVRLLNIAWVDNMLSTAYYSWQRCSLSYGTQGMQLVRSVAVRRCSTAR